MRRRDMSRGSGSDSTGPPVGPGRNVALVAPSSNYRCWAEYWHGSVAMRLLKLAITPRIPSRSFSSSSPSSSSSSSWTDAIRSSAVAGRHRHALSLYALMYGSGHRPDPFAISAALKSCARLHSKPLATAVHSHILKLGHHSNAYAQTALLDVYSKLDGIETARNLFDELSVRNVVAWNAILSSYLRAGQLEEAWRVFDGMPVRDVVTWNSMLSGYAKARHMDHAAELFRSMKEKNAASWTGMISGYIDNGDIGMAKKLFDEMPVRSNVSWITMISGYAKSGDVRSARKLFYEMEERDVFCWNAMISCYAQNGCPSEAIQLFNRMKKPDLNVMPDNMTLSSVISACSQLGDLRFGSWVEEYMGCIGIELDDHLGTALVDLYSKCGCMDKASEHFSRLKKRDLVAYSAMILGCAINGKSSEAASLFKEMVEARVQPNDVTFVGILTAYNHAGLVEEARRCFASMWIKYRVSPSVDHYAIMVDLLGRSGRLEEAYQLICKMPMEPHAGVWGALLLACRLHGNVELGELAAKNSIELDPEATGYYVILSNIYAETGNWESAKRIRKIMSEKGLAKMPGYSCATA